MSDTHDHEIAKAVLYNHLSADTQETVQKAMEDKAKAQDFSQEVKDAAKHVKKHAEDRAHEIAKNAKKQFQDSALQAALEVDPQKLRDRATLIEQAADLLQGYPGPSDAIGSGGAYLPLWCGFEHAVDATNNLNTATYQVLYMLNQCLVDMYRLRDNLNIAAANYQLLDDDAADNLGGKVKGWAGDEWDKAQGWYGDKKAKAQALADDEKAKVQGWEDAEKEKAKDWWQNKPEPEPEPEPETDPVTGQPLAAAAPPVSAAPAPPTAGESSTSSRTVSDAQPTSIGAGQMPASLTVPNYFAPNDAKNPLNDSSMHLLDTQCANIDSEHYMDIFEVIYGRSACIEFPSLQLNPLTGRSISLDEFSTTWNGYINEKLDKLTNSTNEYQDLFGDIETWTGAAATAFEETIGRVSDALSKVSDGCAAIAGRADKLNTAFSDLYSQHVSAEGVQEGAVLHRKDLDDLYDSYMKLGSTEDKKEDDQTDHYNDIHSLASKSDEIANGFKSSLNDLIDYPWKSSDVDDIAPGEQKSNPENWPSGPDFNPVDPFDPQPFDPSDPFGPYGPFGPGGLIKPWKHRDKPDNPPDPVDPGHDFPHRLPDPGSDDDGDSSDIPSLPDEGDAATDDLGTTGIPGMPSTGRPSGSGGPSVKAASYGGGGGGGGVPSMPLGPATPGEGSLGAGAPGSGAGAGAGAGAGRGIPAGAMGGMGGAPMGGAPGAGGKGQQEGKGKRGPQEDEALYTEDRAWTEAVIGNRPRKAATDNKGTK